MRGLSLLAAMTVPSVCSLGSVSVFADHVIISAMTPVSRIACSAMNVSRKVLGSVECQICRYVGNNPPSINCLDYTTETYESPAPGEGCMTRENFLPEANVSAYCKFTIVGGAAKDVRARLLVLDTTDDNAILSLPAEDILPDFFIAPGGPGGIRDR